MLFNIYFQKSPKVTAEDNDETIYTKIYKSSGNEIKNSKILNSNEYKRQQLIKHQLFTADVDIKIWLKVLYKQCVSFILQW